MRKRLNLTSTVNSTVHTSFLNPYISSKKMISKTIKDGIRKAGGVPMEFPTHPIQETGKRPTAALDRNLSYLSLVEVL